MTFPEYERFEAKGATTIDAWLKKLEEEQKADRGPKFLLGPRTPRHRAAALVVFRGDAEQAASHSRWRQRECC